MRWLREVGLGDWVLEQHRRGATVIGICGGFQMLGRTVCDPLGVESQASSAEGLGLLPVDTTMAAEKTTEVRSAITRGGVQFGAYEIHLGITAVEGGVEPFARLDDGRFDGACVDRVVGTYLHGALENAEVCAELFGVPVPYRLGLPSASGTNGWLTGSSSMDAGWSGSASCEG